MSASELPGEQLNLLRRTFFKNKTEKQFFQERNLLLQAISFPAAHLKERYGVVTPDPLSATILQTVIETIVQKGNRSKIKRFSVYFLHCIQEHMDHHGEEYYNLAKVARTAADSLPAVMGQLRKCTSLVTTSSLPELHRILKSRGGRKKRVVETQIQLI